MVRLTRRELLTAAPPRAFLHVPQGGFSIHPRSDWAIDRPPKGPLPTEDVRFLLVHHSASRNGHTGDDAPAILRSFYDYHTGPKGWNDIAYNFLIDADGGIWEGRFGSLDGPVAGDATGGNQGYTQLVCVIGDYNTAKPTRASLDSLVWLLAWLADRYGISTAPDAEVTFVSRGSNRWPAGAEVTTPTITGHRTMSKTTCPGDNLWSYVVGDLIADVEAYRAGGTLPPATTVPPASTTTTTQPHQHPTTTTSTTTPSSTTTSTTTPSTTTPSFPPATALPPSRGNPEALLATPPPSALPLYLARPAAGAALTGVLGLLLWRHRRISRRRH